MNKHADLKYEGNICISGLTASGKSTHAHLLAGEFGLTYVSGSQIQLNFLGVSPIQSKDFWITLESKKLWNEEQFEKIDSELLRLEKQSAGYIFDTSTMPWRHRKPSLCIWLESNLDSRVIKSIVSHRGRSQFGDEDYHEKIQEKDRATIGLYKKLYNIDIGTELSCFDLIIDISSFIKAPTLINSLNSIKKTHKIIRAACGYYLTKLPIFRDELIESIKENEKYILHNSLLKTI
jgi:cytidylate kinase